MQDIDAVVLIGLTLKSIGIANNTDDLDDWIKNNQPNNIDYVMSEMWPDEIIVGIKISSVEGMTYHRYDPNKYIEKIRGAQDEFEMLFGKQPKLYVISDIYI